MCENFFHATEANDLVQNVVCSTVPPGKDPRNHDSMWPPSTTFSDFDGREPRLVGTQDYRRVARLKPAT